MSEIRCTDAPEIDDDLPGCQDCDEPTLLTDDTGRKALCARCAEAREREEFDGPRDDAYERAAARARSNDFEETGGKDWT